MRIFTDALENEFLDENIQNAIIKFSDLMGDIRTFAAKYLFAEKTPGQMYASDYEA